jgi:hypothetical protein
MKLLSVDIPAAVFDVSLLTLTIYFLYVYAVKWLGDLTAFRSWYRETSIWSNFGTNMKLDKTFINGGVDLLKALSELEKKGGFPETFDKLDAETDSTPISPLSADTAANLRAAHLQMVQCIRGANPLDYMGVYEHPQSRKISLCERNSSGSWVWYDDYISAVQWPSYLPKPGGDDSTGTKREHLLGLIQ